MFIASRVWLLFALAALPALSQQSVRELSRVEGIVVAANGDPLPGARVVLRPEAAVGVNDPNNRSIPEYVTISDVQGRFALNGIVPGRYRLGGSLRGYLDGEYGQRRPRRRGAVLDLTTRQELRDIAIRLSVGGVITGRVYATDGRAFPGARVRLLRRRYREFGQPVFSEAGGTSTNDLGEFRLFGIAPGEYFIAASDLENRESTDRTVVDQSPRPDLVIQPVFYPNVYDIGQSMPITVEAGSELGGIDLTLPRVPVVSVSGRVLHAETGLAVGDAHIVVRRKAPDFDLPFWSVLSSRTDSSGNFEIRRVPTGTYVFWAGTSLRIGPSDLSGQVETQVGDKDIEDLQIVIERRFPLTGKISVEAKTSGRINLSFISTENGTGVSGSTQPDGTFSISVSSGHYRIAVDRSSGYYIRAARSGTRNVAAEGIAAVPRVEPLEVVLAPARASVQGTVTDERGQPSVGSRVVLVPSVDRNRFDLYSVATTDQFGRFNIAAVAPGDYKVFAWADIEDFAYFDPDFLRRYDPQGTLIHVAQNESVRASFRVIP